jgi:low temperature requirement protein LtrA
VAAARRERWARLRRLLWQPPRAHGEQPRERVVGPLELFYDLAVVVLVAQIVTGTAACAVLLAGTALLPASARIPAWGLLDAAYLAGFAFVILKAIPAQAATLAITDALTERFGLLTIIVLGETLTGVVQGLAGQPVSGMTLSVGLVAVVVGFGAWWTYFDFAGHRHTRPEPTAALQWMVSHLPLTAAIAAMGAAMVSLVHHAHDSRTPAATAWILCAGTAVVLGATMLISATLQAWHRDRGLYQPLARTCAAVALACLALGAVRPAPLLLGLALVLLLSIPWGLAVRYRLAGRPGSAPGQGGGGGAGII